MALGGSKGSEKSKNNTVTSGTTSTTLDPALSSALYTNVDRATGLTPYTGYTGEMVAGFNPDQQAAQDRARAFAGAGVGADLLNTAAGAATGAATYKPGQVSAGGYTPFTGAAAGINRGSIRDVGYSDTDQAAIDRFMNPYTDEVVNRSTGDLEQAREREQADNSAFATKMGAFRGTGLFNARDRTTEKFADAIGDTSANLRYQGFDRAVTGAQTDAARRAAIEGQNQGVDASVASQNAAMQQQAMLDRAAREDAASRYGADQAFNAATANNQFGQAGAATNLAGAGALGAIAGQQRANATGDINLLNEVGNTQQANDQAKLDAAYGEYGKENEGQYDWLSAINQALGLVPQTGTTTANGTQLGTSSGKSKGLQAGVA